MIIRNGWWNYLSYIMINKTKKKLTKKGVETRSRFAKRDPS